jgi:hypothetical protein
MPDSNPQRRRRQIETRRTRLARPDGLAFTDVRPSDQVEAARREEGVGRRHKVYTPQVTLWAVLAQVASRDGCCRAAVARVLAWPIGRGRPPCRPGTGGYCKARARPPEGLPRRLTRHTGPALCRPADGNGPWQGRRVKVADGTTLSVPDTPANRRAYPRPDARGPGLGFPIVRAVVVFCLAAGAVIDAAPGRCQGERTGEAARLRQLADAFEAGDVVLGDRTFGGFYELAFRPSRGAGAVIRLHQSRRVDFRAGRRLGRGATSSGPSRAGRGGWTTRRSPPSRAGWRFARWRCA